METSISLIGVILAAASSFIVGTIWYGPATFLGPWKKMTGVTDEDMKKNFPRAMAYIAVASLLTAYILAHFMLYSEKFSGVSGVGAVANRFLGLARFCGYHNRGNGALETRNPVLMVIYAGNRLVTLLVMGLILGLFMR